MSVHVVIAAAGTGGHIYPGLAVAQELRALDPQAAVTFLTTRRGLGPVLLRRHGEAFHVVAGEPAPARLSPAAAVFAAALARGAVEAAWRLRALGARVVLATGGYGCAPAVAGARMVRIPVVWQEQNALPGRATRLMARWARAVALGFEEARNRLPAPVQARAVVTGNPVRRELLTVGREEGIRRLGLEAGLRTVLVVGASQGARRFNFAVVEAAEELAHLEGAQVLVSTGQSQFDEVEAALSARYPGGRRDSGGWRLGRLRVVPYVDDMPAAVAAADLAVSRAGAISIAEYTARGVPLILVPYPYAAEGHQQLNARAVERAGAGVVVPDGALTGSRLVEVIRELLKSPERLRAMAQASRRLGRPGAAEEVARLVLQAAGA